MSGQIPIRVASKDEAGLLAKIHQQCFPSHWDKKEFEDLFAAAGTRGWLAGEAGMVVCRVLHEQSEIITLAVMPAARRQGLARALLEATLKAAAESGANRMFLEVSEDNAAALALYESYGFTLISRRKAYYRQPDGNMTDALVMAREFA